MKKSEIHETLLSIRDELARWERDEYTNSDGHICDLIVDLDAVLEVTVEDVVDEIMDTPDDVLMAELKANPEMQAQLFKTKTMINNLISEVSRLKEAHEEILRGVNADARSALISQQALITRAMETEQ